MQKVIRVAMVILLVLVTVAIVTSQTRLYGQQHVQLPWNTTAAQATSALPLSVAGDAAEREKDREILRAIEKDVNKLAASSLAQNYLMLFQAIIYFLILIIIFSMLETVKKFADAASKSAEASRISAEAASKAGGGHVHTPHCGGKRHDVNKFIMRRLRGNYWKK